MNIEDIVQICLGSTILAIPVALTEEAWAMSTTLPQLNIILIFLTSLIFNGCFIYYGVYEGAIKGKILRFISRIAINYVITLITVAYILFLLGILPTHFEFHLWLHRIILISFPASLSGAVVDSFDKE